MEKSHRAQQSAPRQAYALLADCWAFISSVHSTQSSAHFKQDNQD